MNPAEILAVLGAATQNAGDRYAVTTKQGVHYPMLHLRSFSTHWQHGRSLDAYLFFADNDSNEFVLAGSSLTKFEPVKNWLKKKKPAKT